MLDRLSSFKSNFISKIQIFGRLYYAFCQYLDTSTYITYLSDKKRYFYDNIKFIRNENHG